MSSGTIKLESASGDRLGKFNILNMQLSTSRRLAEVRADSRPELWETTATAVAEPAGGGGGGGAKQPGTGGRRAAPNASMYERGQVFAQEKALRLQLKAAALQRDCDATV